MKKIKKRIRKIRNKIKFLQYLYYIKNLSKVSDKKYDLLMQELNRLEKIYPTEENNLSPSKTIGNYIDINFQKIKHNKYMLSLNSIFKIEDFIEFDKKINKLINKKDPIKYCCEPKIDGVAINLVYKNKKLIQAATRGNGIFGEDVTNNVYNIKDIPTFLKGYKIPDLIEIRGEIFMLKKNFSQLNQEIKEKKFTSTRNAASGSLRQINPEITNCRKLNFLCYDTGFVSNGKFYNQWDKLQKIESWGIPVSKYNKLCCTYDDIFNYFYKMEKIRFNLDFDIDGIVVKVNDIQHQKIIGYTAKAPKWAVAIKFKSQEKIAQLQDIIFQVGRTGTITPIAKFSKVLINGASISKANLYNLNEIKKLKLMIGDFIVISRVGDVIPKIVKVLYNKRKNVTPIQYPTLCPVCNSHLNYSQNKIKCIATFNCPAQLEKRIIHFSSREGLNIKGLGKEVIKKLIKHKLIQDISDIFILKEKDFNISKIFCKKTVTNLLNSISLSKNTMLSNFIYALGIDGVGENTAKNIAKYYTSLERIMSADLKSFKNIPTVGHKTSMNILNFFQNQKNKKILKKILDCIFINNDY